MGTATTMNSLAEALGMQLPGSAAIPAPHRDRQQVAYRTGKRAVEIVRENLRPSDIMTRNAFLNAIVVNSAIGGSTNAPIHLAAIARHAGVELSIDDWQTAGHDVPLIVNLQPAGEYLGEDYFRAGGVPAVVAELMRHGLIHEDAATINGRSIGENCGASEILLPDVIRTFETALKPAAGFTVMRGNLFNSAIMKTSVISTVFRERFLSNPEDPNAFEGRAIVFDGPEQYHKQIDDEALGITDTDILVMRGAGPIGYPGAAEVVNMRPPNYLIRQGVLELPCLGDGRQSGTSGSPSILNASPEAAAGGNLALVRNHDRIRIDVGRSRVDLLIDDTEMAKRREELEAAGGYVYPASQTPWQAIQRQMVGQMETGAILEGAEAFQRIDTSFGVPRDSH
jgi:dihydroxy-acid dehydratase